VHFLRLEPRETDKNVLKLSWNFLKIGSWNFTSCFFEPCCCGNVTRCKVKVVKLLGVWGYGGVIPPAN